MSKIIKFKGVLDGFRSAQPAKAEEDVVETLKSEHFQVAKVRSKILLYFNGQRPSVGLRWRRPQPFVSSSISSTFLPIIIKLIIESTLLSTYTVNVAAALASWLVPVRDSATASSVDYNLNERRAS